ncbi:glycosyltransferase family 2 protein [candidate division WWE3 bacterium]|nr:glycosyltransferase family 2 protein [candidate division WWE3 bacterium]
MNNQCCTIVITAYNNEHTIRQSLESFLNQTAISQIQEIIVVSDGSTDNTEMIVEEIRKGYPIVRLIRQGNLGVAAARNQGMREANSPILLYSQADIFAQPTLIEQHMLFHDAHQDIHDAAVGFTTWSKQLTITPFMEWLEDGGPQFNYHHLTDNQITTFETFYTTNISLKTEFLRQNSGFDESFKIGNGITAYEDTELGYRLSQQGMKLTYLANAICYHHHPKNVSAVLKRRYYEGWMAHKLHKKHPSLTWSRRFSDLQLFFITILVINPIVFFPFIQLVYYYETRQRADKLFKLVCRSTYNWGYLKGFFNPL